MRLGKKQMMLDDECDFLLTASLGGDHECWRVCKGGSPILFIPPLAFQSPPSTGVQGRMLDKVLPKRVPRHVCLRRLIEWEKGQKSVLSTIICSM